MKTFQISPSFILKTSPQRLLRDNYSCFLIINALHYYQVSKGNQVFPGRLIKGTDFLFKINEKGTLIISENLFLYSAVPENIDAHHKGGLWKFRGRIGSQQPISVKESMKLRWKFQERGWGGRFFL